MSPRIGRALPPKKVQEILENWKDFADHCSLKPLERRRAMAASSGGARCGSVVFG